MWHISLQSVKVLRPTVKEMPLQENTLFDLDRHTKCNTVPFTSRDLCTAKFEVAVSNGLGGDAVARKCII